MSLIFISLHASQASQTRLLLIQDLLRWLRLNKFSIFLTYLFAGVPLLWVGADNGWINREESLWLVFLTITDINASPFTLSEKVERAGPEV
jgi:hypothetical protein